MGINVRKGLHRELPPARRAGRPRRTQVAASNFLPTSTFISTSTFTDRADRQQETNSRKDCAATRAVGAAARTVALAAAVAQKLHFTSKSRWNAMRAAEADRPAVESALQRVIGGVVRKNLRAVGGSPGR